MILKLSTESVFSVQLACSLSAISCIRTLAAIAASLVGLNSRTSGLAVPELSKVSGRTIVLRARGGLAAALTWKR